MNVKYIFEYCSPVDPECWAKLPFMGRMEYGPTYKPDKAAKGFWEAVLYEAGNMQSEIGVAKMAMDVMHIRQTIEMMASAQRTKGYGTSMFLP